MFIVLVRYSNLWDAWVKGPFQSRDEAVIWIKDEHERLEDDVVLHEVGDNFYPWDGDNGGYSVIELPT